VADLHPEGEDGGALPDWAVVVRGGVATPRLVSGAVERHFAMQSRDGRPGTYDASVWSFAALYAEEIVRVVRELNRGDLPHTRMQTATAGAVRALGYQVIRTLPDKPGHYSVRFPSRPADTDIDAFLNILSPPRPTPPKGGDDAPPTS
jgi:hypothetical protein